MTTPALVPYPLPVLLGRVAREWGTRHRIFDLPTGRFHRSVEGLDLSIEVAGRRAATPLGPAAGPNTQLAQNMVLGWLAGARTFELKTVQVLDELVIPRPCIDMEGVGYNVEWSQELQIRRSVDEYVKAWMTLHVLSAWEPLREEIGEPGPHVFDMSVGYDLAGIRSEAMDGFIRGLLDASAIIDRLRPGVPEPFARHRDDDFEPHLVGGVTLSTFHGCPPEEIDAIARHLMTEYGLDVVVKLNPTLLGFEAVDELLRRRLGFEEVRLSPAAFDADLQFADAIDLIRSLHEFAGGQGRTFGVKLTNTLVVGNHRRVLPGDEMYLSGAPLHVLAVSLLDRLVDELPGLLAVAGGDGAVPVSFSAGVDRGNVADTVGLGLRPVTMCTNLLKPAGYGNLSAMTHALAAAMEEAGCATVGEWVAARQHAATASGHRDAVGAYAARLVEGVPGAYGVDGVVHRSRVVDRDLDTWDCVSCNLCVVVCPNDAMLRLPTPEEAGSLEERWQYLCFAELCNDCGNCTTFCPERGDPFLAKPRLFLDGEVFSQEDGRAFLLKAEDGSVAVEAKAAGSGDVQLLRLVLGGPDGLPLRAEDLRSAASR
jgi:putative selenate reductase